MYQMVKDSVGICHYRELYHLQIVALLIFVMSDFLLTCLLECLQNTQTPPPPPPPPNKPRGQGFSLSRSFILHYPKGIMFVTL